MSVLKGVKALKQYIYISSDSVYEATSLYRILESPDEVIENSKLQRERLDKLEEKSEDGGTNELMANIEVSMTQMKQTEKEMYKRLENNDSYGLRKLHVEQELFTHFAESEVSVLSLRLADVIGPYDDSCRFWKYPLWAQVAKQWPITLDEAERNVKVSFTFSCDVVQTIMG